MKRRQFNVFMGTAAALSAMLSLEAAAASEPVWSFSADIAESCSCDISCQCNFGRPTKRRCDGSRLVQITKGQIDDADLAGVSFVRTFEMGRWAKIYADESTSEEKMRAFEKVFPLAFSSHHKLMRSMEWVPLSVERGEEMVRFSVPASTVEIKLLRGMDGQPITINGLPSPVFYDSVQYESTILTHKSDAAEFSYSGTNGMGSRRGWSSAAADDRQVREQRVEVLHSQTHAIREFGDDAWGGLLERRSGAAVDGPFRVLFSRLRCGMGTTATRPQNRRWQLMPRLRFTAYFVEKLPELCVS